MTDPQSLLAVALAQLQTRLPRIEKSETANVVTQKGTYSYTYANLANLSEAILPLLGQLGLSFTCRPTFAGDRFVLAYRLWHTSGEYLEGEFPLPTSGTPQAVGSAITYARRYCLCSMTGVAPEDDDDGATAEAAAGTRHGTAQRAVKPATRTRPSAEQKIRRSQAAEPPLPTDQPAPEQAVEMITGPQSRKMHALYNQVQITDRDERLAHVAVTLNRKVSSSKELTKDEAGRLIDSLEQAAAQDHESNLVDAQNVDGDQHAEGQG